MRILLLVLMATAAAPPSPDELARDADAAFDRGDDALAESLYARAAGRSTDPGLIAFNRGIVSMRSGRLIDAERSFRRSLDDGEASAERRARAWFNLGNCLVEHTPADAARLRTAIECYRRCLELSPEEPLHGWAANNLEVAKLRWNAEREKQPAGDTPNDEPRELSQLPDRQPKKMSDDREADPTGKGDPSKSEKTNAPPPKGTEAKKSDAKPSPGAGQLPVLPDTDAVAPLTTEEATEYLRESAERLKRERRNLSRAATRGGRADVRNW